MPWKPSDCGRPSTPARLVSWPPAPMEKAPTAPAPDSMVKRNLPSLLVARSRLKLPAGKAPTTNPEIFADAVFEVNRNFPFGVTLIQQVAAPSVGTLVLMAVYAPFAPS